MKKKIGMIIAVEFAPFEQAYGKASQKINKQGYEVSLYEKENYVLYVLQSGAGEIQAAMSTQFLIDEFGVEMILNYGVVGALTEKLSHALVCIVKEVVDYRFDISEVDNVPVGRHIEFPERNFETDSFLRKKALEVEPNLLEVVDASGDRFVNKAEEKQAIEIEKLKRELERSKMVIEVLKKNIEIQERMERDSRLLGKKTNTKR